MKSSFLGTINVKKTILYILTLLFAYSISRAIFNIMERVSMGTIFVNLMSTTPYLLLIILVSMYDVRRFSFASLVPTRPIKIDLNLLLKKYSWIVLLAVIIGFLSSITLMGLGLVYVPVIIIIIVSFVVSCFCMIKGKNIYSIIAFLVSIPFLFFIQRNSLELGFENLTISEITIPFSVIYLIIIFLLFLVCNSSSRVITSLRIDNNILSIFSILALAGIFPIIFSKDPYHSFVYYFITIIIPFIYFYILLKSIKSINDVKNYLTFLIFSIFLYQFFALYYRFQIGGLESVTTGLAGMESMKGIDTGIFLALISLIITYQLAMYNLSKGWIRTAFGFTSLFLILILLLRNNRASTLGILICCIVFLYYYRISIEKKTYFFITGILSFIIVVYYFPNVLEILQLHRVFETFSRLSAGETLDVVSSNRIDIWGAAINMIRDFPIFGIGPGMWDTYISQYSIDPYFYRDIFGIRIRYYAIDPHNIYLLMWLDYGMIGIFCFLSIIYTAIKIGVSTIKESSSTFIRTISIASIASIIAFVIMGFFTIRFIGETLLLSIMFWSIIVIILKLDEFNPTSSLNNVDLKT